DPPNEATSNESVMLFRPTLIVALLLALAASHQVAAAQVELGESYVADQPDRIDSGFILYPAPLSSRTAGFAAGIGYEIRNFPFPRAEIRALAVPGQHLGRYALGLSVGNAYTDALSAWTAVYYEATGRQWYYGMNTTDRKSTRLNSSHVKNSYAVFCLKKKKLCFTIVSIPITINSNYVLYQSAK